MDEALDTEVHGILPQITTLLMGQRVFPTLHCLNIPPTTAELWFKSSVAPGLEQHIGAKYDNS
jgi:hypothetical protein